MVQSVDRFRALSDEELLLYGKEHPMPWSEEYQLALFERYENLIVYIF